MRKNLAEIIKQNPGCVAVIDNDTWTLYKAHPCENPHDGLGAEWEAWEQGNELANDSDVEPVGDGYGSGHCYGGDILQALAQIVGITIESV